MATQSAQHCLFDVYAMLALHTSMIKSRYSRNDVTPCAHGQSERELPGPLYAKAAGYTVWHDVPSPLYPSMIFSGLSLSSGRIKLSQCSQ